MIGDGTRCGSDKKVAPSRTAAGDRVRWGQRRDLGEESPNKWGQAEKMVAGGWGSRRHSCGFSLVGRIRLVGPACLRNKDFIISETNF
jgi:hypothetical protein